MENYKITKDEKRLQDYKNNIKEYFFNYLSYLPKNKTLQEIKNDFLEGEKEEIKNVFKNQKYYEKAYTIVKNFIDTMSF